MARMTYQEALGSEKGYWAYRLLAVLASGKNPDGTDFFLPTEGVGKNENLHTGTAVFANSAPVNTAVNVDIPVPALLQKDGLYLVTVYNPSTVTALTVSARVRETLDGAVRAAELATFTVPVGGVGSKVVQGLLLGDGGRLVVSNNTVLGSTQGFTAHTRVRKV